jgi:hypothetical protein
MSFPVLVASQTCTYSVFRTTCGQLNATPDFAWLDDLNNSNFEYNSLPELDLGFQSLGQLQYAPGFVVNHLVDHSSSLLSFETSPNPPLASASSPTSSTTSYSSASTHVSSSSSNMGSAIPAVNDSDMVTCEWDNCGHPFPRSNLDSHFVLFHPSALVSQSDNILPCLWGSCTSRGGRLGRHVRSHVVLHPCAACGDTFARADAAHRHRIRGSCVKCSGCKHKFASIDEKIMHVMMGCPRQGARNGRSKTVSKDAKVVARHQPY